MPIRRPSCGSSPGSGSCSRGKSVTRAIHAWLGGLTIAECGSTLVAIQLRELLQVVGEDKFDQLFGSTNRQLVPSIQRLVITSDVGQCIPEAMIKGAGVTERAPPRSYPTITWLHR